VVVFPNESSVSYCGSETSVNTSVHSVYLHSYQLPFNGTWPVLLNSRQLRVLLVMCTAGDVYCWWCVLLTVHYCGDKVKEVKWAGHGACTWEKRNSYGILVRKPEM